MYFEDDVNKAFQPLVDHLSDSFMDQEDVNGTLNQYMYMFHDDEKHYYKHFGSRKHVKIDSNGKAEGEIENWRKW